MNLNDLTTALDTPPPKQAIQQRQGGGGRQLDYLPGHHVITEANRIFGVDGWHMEIIDLSQVGGLYVGRVRVIVDVGDPNDDVQRTVSREDVGTGIPANDSPGAHDTAVKGAITDAMKRALRTFGEAFGNGLYRQGAPKVEPRNTGPRWLAKGKDAQVYGGGAVKAYVRRLAEGQFETALTVNDVKVEDHDKVYPDGASAKEAAEKAYREIAATAR